VEVHGAPAQQRLHVLHDLLMASGKDGRLFEIRLVPDAEFGFVHGKGGIIDGPGVPGGKTSFIGSANDSAGAWTKNYELVWEDDTPESVTWVQYEFDALWAKGFPLSEFIVNQIGRLSQRTVIDHVGPWREKHTPAPLLAAVPTATELFRFWDHQKYFINLAFQVHLKYRNDPLRGARFLLCDGVGLGKTLQLGALAKLIGTLDSLPILILAPKPLLAQWQEELLMKLAIPSARWEGGMNGGRVPAVAYCARLRRPAARAPSGSSSSGGRPAACNAPCMVPSPTGDGAVMSFTPPNGTMRNSSEEPA